VTHHAGLLRMCAVLEVENRQPSNFTKPCCAPSAKSKSQSSQLSLRLGAQADALGNATVQNFGYRCSSSFIYLPARRRLLKLRLSRLRPPWAC
jgi:hypothetical protein